jgi:hypothetical protein
MQIQSLARVSRDDLVGSTQAPDSSFLALQKPLSEAIRRLPGSEAAISCR